MSVFTNAVASHSAQQATAYTTAVLGLLGTQDPLQVLQHTVPALRQIVQAMTRTQLVEREAPGKWSVRHVVQHLADSELVGGYRFRMILAHERPHLTGYDQDAWAERLGYDQADPEQALDDFAVLRGANLRLFARCSPADLKRVSVHEERGEENLGLLMRLYAGHDLLHLRQIDRIGHAIGAVASGSHPR